MLRRYLVSDPTLSLKSFFCLLDFGVIKKDCMYWLRSLFTLCASFICLSLSDDANKIKTLNIERAQQFQLPLKIWARYTRWFRRNSLLKTRNFTENVWLVNIFATQQFRSLWWLIFPSILLAKSWKLHNSSTQSALSIFAFSSYLRLSCMSWVVC